MPQNVISAYIPVFNNSSTIAATINAILAQSLPPSELLVVDDGSTDGSATRVRKGEARVISCERNRGRGAARARAMQEARHEFVLCCDATNVLERDFTRKALALLEDPGVAAVFGKLDQPTPVTVAERWRGRHLLKSDRANSLRGNASLATWAAVLRKSAVLAVGNFDERLRHSEDADLGERLLRAGYKVIYDPALKATNIGANRVRHVLERYWRWHAGKNTPVSASSYLKQIHYSFRVMALQDLRARDPWAAAMSIWCPHYQLWRSVCARCSAAAGSIFR